MSAAVAVALVSGTMLVGGVAQAVTPVSQSEGRFLSGTVGATNLDTIATLAGAQATNTGQPTVTSLNPLDVTALNAVNLDLGNGLNLLGQNGLLTLGAVNQYASASPDGSSKSASGAVSDTGAIAIDGTGTGTPAADATLNLTNLLGGQSLTGVFSTANLHVGAVAATANETAAGVQSSTYKIASLGLDLKSPLVSGLVTTLTNTLQPIINTLTGLLQALPLGIVSVGPLPSVATLLAAIGTVTSADGSITVNLSTGDIHIDVNKLLITAGLDINNLPPNTDLLPLIVSALTTQLLPAITSALTGLIASLTTAIDGISVTVLGIPVPLATLAPVLNPVIAQLTGLINGTVTGLPVGVIAPIGSALNTLLSLKANVQPNLANTAPAFSVSALQVGVVPGTPGLAVVNLAKASVGANGGALVPTAASLLPTHGPAAGGTSVVITGTNFIPGNTTVTIGGATVPAGSVTVNAGGTTATFTTPPHAVGPVTVTATTPGGTTGPLTYTYDPAGPPVPTAASLLPTHGQAAGGTSVVITGTGFIPGSTTVNIGGATVPAGSVTVNAGGTTATFTTPAHAVGPVTVTATTPGGTTGPLTYTYDPAGPVGPTAISLSPDHGPVAGGTSVTVIGTGFVPGSTSVLIGGNTVPANQVTVDPSGTTATFLTPPHPIGGVLVTLTTPGGTTNPLGYLYGYDPVPAQSCVLTGVNPLTGLNAATVSLTANTGISSSLVPSVFTVNDGTHFTPTLVTPFLGGFVVVSVSAPVTVGTTSIDYTLHPVIGSAYVTITGSIPCTDITPPQANAGVYYPLTPSRILDTRTDGGHSAPLAPGETRVLDILGQGGVPNTGVATVVLNMTVVSPTDVGYLTVFPEGVHPVASNIDYVAHQTVANLTVSPLGSDGKVRIYNGSAGFTQVIADVNGYFSSGDTVAPGSYVRVTPVRILDTQTGAGQPSVKPVPALGTIKVPVTGVGGVPATNVSAVVLNVTVDKAQSDGFITIAPTPPHPPISVSSLNFLKNATNANLVIAPVSADGSVYMYNSAKGSVRLIADVSGYFLGGIPLLKGEFVALPPTRILDSRINQNAAPKIQALHSITPTILGRGPVPASHVLAVVMNMTATREAWTGFATVWPAGPRPKASNVQFMANLSRPIAVITPIGPDGRIRMFNGSSGNIDLLADVSGYFINP